MADKEKEAKSEKLEDAVWRKSSPATKDEFEKHRNKLLQMSEISLWLDTYDDIFSDFDPRPFSQRALSDDFLLEAKKASKEKISGAIELKFLVPHDQRNGPTEENIKKRLREHFKRHHELLCREISAIKNNGILLAVIGFAMIIAAAYVSGLEANKFLMNMLVVILEPAGWFTTWTGLDDIFHSPLQRKADLDFYEKMSKCEISFLSY